MALNLRTKKSEEWWQALPFPFSSFAVSEGSRPEGFRFSRHIINAEAELFGRKVVACGEADTPELAITKAIAELLERSALLTYSLDHPGNASSSNGWAAHSDVESARTAASLELCERDAVLAQWYTATPFLEIPESELPQSIQQWRSSELTISEFPILRVLLSTCGLGPSVTCLFMNERGFGVSSHSTKSTLAESIDSAIAETCRAAHHTLRKAFWRDTLALKSGEATDVTPGTHSVYYAYHEPLPNWMFGESVSWNDADILWRSGIESALALETQFQVLLESPVVVGFARNPLALPLNWGTTKIESVLETAAGKRLAAQTPEWNLKPHIIS